MKKIFYLSLMVLLAQANYAQAPQGINYQGVARNATGQAIPSASISLQIKLYQGNPNSGGVLMYQEVHAAVTDLFGLYNVVVGQGSQQSAQSFSQVPWASGNIWVSVWMDPSGGTAYSLVADQQLMSVPYALYAATAGGGGGGGISGTAHNIPKINSTGNGLKQSLLYESIDSASVGIATSNPNANAVLDIMNTGTPGAAGKGLLIPRMTDQERNAIPASALNHGLLVYQTNSPNVLSPEGFWYYDAIATAWLMLAPSQAVWTLGGNALGNTSFLGSLDDKDIVFKTGFLTAIERMRVLSNANGGNVQFGTPGGEYKFPVTKGAAGDILQLDPGGTNSLLWKPFSGGGSSPWVKTGGIVTLLNAGDTVGIGIANPQAQLHLENNLNQTGALTIRHNVTSSSPAIVFETMNPANGSTVLDVSTVGGGTAIRAIGTTGYGISANSQTSSAIWAQSNSANQPALDATNLGGHGAAFLESTSDGTATLEASNLGKHAVAYFHNLGINGSSSVLYVNQNDPSAYTAEFVGGLGIRTIGFEMPTGAITGWVLQSDAFGKGTWTDPANFSPWYKTGSTIAHQAGFNIGIGTTSAGYPLEVAATSTAAAVFVKNTGNGDAIYGNSSGAGNAVTGVSSGSGAGIMGFTNGTGGNAGFFQSSHPSSTVPTLSASHQGFGAAGDFSLSNVSNSADALKISTVGTGAALYAVTTGSGSVGNLLLNNANSNSAAFNVSNNGKGVAGHFQSLNNTSTSPSLWVQQAANAPALKVDGAGNPGAVAAVLNGGAVGIGTGTVMPTSGLDVKTSVGVAVKKYTTATTISIAVTDANTVHLCAASGSFTFTVPDATLCPGRMLIFSADQTVTGGTMIIQACCAQTINGAASQTFGLTTGATKPSVGIISDGSHWQIIFKN